MRTSPFNTALLLDRLAVIAPPCLYGLGVCLLARKVLSLPAFVSPLILAALCLLAVAIWLAVDLSRRETPWFTPEYAAAWLDFHNHAGGTILAESGDAPPLKHLPGITPRHLLGRLVWPAVFVLAAALVPAPQHGETLSGTALERQLDQMEQDIDAAALAEVLPAPDVEDLRRQLQQLRDLALRNPEAAAEALAALPARLEEARTRRLDLAAEAMENAAGVGAEWRDLDSTATEQGGLPPNFAARMEEFRQALDAAAKNEGGPGQMPSELAEAGAVADGQERDGGSGANEGGREGGRTGQLSKEQMDRMLEAMSGYAEKLSRAERAFPGEAGASPAREGALARLETVNEALEGMRTSSAGMAGESGAGGIERGRGDADLSFGDPSSRDGLDVEYRPLTKSEADSPELMLRRERALPDETLPPEEFRRSRRGAAGVAGRIDAGHGGSIAGPARERAVRNYYENLNRDSTQRRD